VPMPLAATASPESAPPPPAALAAAPKTTAPLAFTGNGAEYFRIWVVNVVLTIVTLGIYSAWAKVRKSSYFARNTRLLGDGFEFTANPWAILRGRVLALILLGFYTFAFDFSLTAGLFATGVLLVAAPLLFASATRFRLRNTRWRALRFDFTASNGDAYRTALIVIIVWTSSTVIGALGGLTSAGFAGGAAFLLLPWMHHRMKAFQHRHAWFAGHGSGFRSATGSFYATYAIAFLFLLLAGAGAGLGAAGVAWAMRALATPGSGDPQIIGIVVGLLAGALGYLAIWPYFASRIQRVVWRRTTLGPFAFDTTIAFRTLLPIAMRNFALLLVTAGLYWPFASIAWARYRIQCMSLVSDASPEAAVAALDPGPARGAAGEGAVDMFGIDIGW